MVHYAQHGGWELYVGNLTNIGSYNGLSPGQRKAIIWTNAGILLFWPLGTNISEMLIEIYTFSLKKMHLKMSSGKWRPSCLSLNVLIPLLTLWPSQPDPLSSLAGLGCSRDPYLGPCLLGVGFQWLHHDNYNNPVYQERYCTCPVNSLIPLEMWQNLLSTSELHRISLMRS